MLWVFEQEDGVVEGSEDVLDGYLQGPKELIASMADIDCLLISFPCHYLSTFLQNNQLLALALDLLHCLLHQPQRFANCLHQRQDLVGSEDEGAALMVDECSVDQAYLEEDNHIELKWILYG